MFPVLEAAAPLSLMKDALLLFLEPFPLPELLWGAASEVEQSSLSGWI